MRNKIAFYIGDVRADLDDGSFLLMNYTAEDLSNPTIVKNSFSRQITLKGTPTNNKIFGEIYRNDRNTLYTTDENGAYFDPTRKTSFSIYNEAGELLESGYLKLDKVTKTRKKVEYTVTLYGGLGSFLYGLSYDSNGDKLTLADLTYPYTLDFTINRATVKAAWDQLYNDPDGANKWSVINFIPAYNGLPSGEFNADKAVVHAASCGLPTAQGDYTTQDGWTLVTLPEKVTGNEAKDYRSYLQKPVLRMKALINAICDPANNGGYTVNLDSEFFDDSNPYWAKTWLTLPKMQDLNIDVQSNKGVFYAYPPTTYTIPNGGNMSVLYTLDLSFGLSFAFPGGSSGYYVLGCVDDWAAGQFPDDPGYYLNYIQFDVTLYDNTDTVINEISITASTHQPNEQNQIFDYIFDYIDAASGIPYKDGKKFVVPLKISGYGVAKVKVEMSEKALAWGNLRAGAMNYYVWAQNETDAQDGVDLGSAPTVNPYESNLAWYAETSSTVRTGASITKAALLSTEHTPADYLLSYCKMFGLQIVPRKGQSIVDIVMRKNLYDDSTTVDLSGRIDRGKPIEKVPFSFDARWYAWQTEHAGEWAEYYANKYGMQTGKYRINTGYSFDATEKSVTDGIIFSGACSVLETSKYFCDLSDTGGNIIPALFIGGGKYTLYKGGGESQDYDIPLPVTADKTWNNASYPMHDDWPKMQFHGADNAPMDERDTLVFFNGVVYPTSDYVSLTDDTRIMLQLNGNAPCWLPHYSAYDSSWQLARMPKFTRYIWNVSNVQKSLDFGDPLEAQVPGIVFKADSNIYDQYWSKYIADRYDDDSAVVTAWVDLRGMKVDETLLRKFYYFDGAVWAMNRIINHSLTTSGPTQCEFVKVQDTDNYTS